MRKQRLTCLRFTCQKSQSSLITEPCLRAADRHLLQLSSQEGPSRLRICTGFSVPPALPGPGSTGDTATLCHPSWHTMKSGGPHSSCSTLPNLSEHISCAHKPAHQLSAPIKECEMWLIQSLQRGDQANGVLAMLLQVPLVAQAMLFSWHSAPTPRWPLWCLHLPFISLLSLWSSRTVPSPASPSINRLFCPNSVSSDKQICRVVSGRSRINTQFSQR